MFVPGTKKASGVAARILLDVKIKKEKNMKKLLALLLALVMVAALAACGSAAPAPAAPAAEAAAAPAAAPADPAAPAYKFAVVVHDNSNSFTAEFKRGAEAAAAALGCAVDCTGPDAQVIEEQVTILENVVEKGYDGIACICGDGAAFQAAVDNCAAKDIPFVTFNMDDGKYGAGYAGAVEYNLAYAFAEYFFANVAPESGSTEYIIGTADSGLPVCVTRAQAIRDAGKAAGFTELKTVDYGYDFADAEAVMENTLTANPDCKIYLGTDHISQNIAAAVAATGVADTTWVGCFDLLEQTIVYLQDGACDLIVGQNPYLQAYYAVVMLYNLKTDGICPANIDTGAELVTRDMADDVMVKYFG